MREPSPDLLARVRTGDRQAADELVRSQTPLVRRVVARVGRPPRGLDHDDMRQEGLMAVVRAGRTFNHALGYRWSTYAWVCVAKAVASLLGRSALRAVALPVDADGEVLLAARPDRPPPELPPELAELPPLDRAVLVHAYGLEGTPAPNAPGRGTPNKLAAVAAVLGLTPGHAGRVRRRAVARLREGMADDGAADAAICFRRGPVPRARPVAVCAA